MQTHSCMLTHGWVMPMLLIVVGGRTAELLVQREPLPRPVAGGAQPAQLTRDEAAVLGLPRPDPALELLPAQGLAVRALRRQHFLHHQLQDVISRGGSQSGVSLRRAYLSLTVASQGTLRRENGRSTALHL